MTAPADIAELLAHVDDLLRRLDEIEDELVRAATDSVVESPHDIEGAS